MTPELNVDETIEAINHCYQFAGRNDLRRSELLCAKKYIWKMRGNVSELDEVRLTALIGLITAAVSEMRDEGAIFLAVDTQQVVANLTDIRDYIQGLSFDDAA